MAEKTIPAVTINEAVDETGFDITYNDNSQYRVPKPAPTTIVAFERKFKVSFTNSQPSFEQLMWQVWHTCKRKKLHPKDLPINTFDKWLDAVEDCTPVMTPKLREFIVEQGLQPA